MSKVFLVGNPNTGKTTLFNSLTKSSEHVGNWHGVTVDAKQKSIVLNGEKIDIVDLPGLYSLNPFSMEEEVSKDAILDASTDKIMCVVDANNFRRNLFLAITLLLEDKNISIVINNYDYFQKHGGKIDCKTLQILLGCDAQIINAQKIKPSKELFDFKTKKSYFINNLKNQIKNVENLEKIKLIYKFIDFIAQKCIVKDKTYIYGTCNADKAILNFFIFLPIFLLTMVGVVYFTFFSVGPILSDGFVFLLDIIFKRPAMAILNLGTKSKFITALFEEGIFGACFSVLGFLPQICLMYLFLSILENSGIISRMAFLFDDALQKIGLNGKIVYTMLMGFGCSTTACLTSKNMTERNSKIKVALLTPFMSCSAKLPIYTTVAGALLGANSIWAILGLYLLGVIVATAMAVIFQKTILPTKDDKFVLEFPPLKLPNLRNVVLSVRTSCWQFICKVFGIIFSISLVAWLLNNLNIKLKYVANPKASILYSFSSLISWIFAPIGLNNPSIICALLIGLVAKELILSSFAISNKVSNLNMLSSSLILAPSAVNFNIASGISFLIFTLLYFPCVSNFAIITKEVGVKFAVFGAGIQFASAYLISLFAYALITKGFSCALIVVLAICLCAIAIKYIYKKIKNKKLFCNNCKNCNKSCKK